MTRKAAIKKLDQGAKDFETWFVAQYGPGPDVAVAVGELLERVNACRLMLQRAERELRDATAYSTLRDAALKAWAARGSK